MEADVQSGHNEGTEIKVGKDLSVFVEKGDNSFSARTENVSILIPDFTTLFSTANSIKNDFIFEGANIAPEKGKSLSIGSKLRSHVSPDHEFAVSNSLIVHPHPSHDGQLVPAINAFLDKFPDRKLLGPNGIEFALNGADSKAIYLSSNAYESVFLVGSEYESRMKEIAQKRKLDDFEGFREVFEDDAFLLVGLTQTMMDKLHIHPQEGLVNIAFNIPDNKSGS